MRYTARKASAAALLVGVLAVLLLAACTGEEATNKEDPARDDEVAQQDTQPATREPKEEREEDTRRTTTANTEPEEREDATAGATLELSGDSGTEFSGYCAVGDGEEEEIQGQVPQTFDYELGGEPLECEISTDGDLQLAFSGGDNTRSVQQINGGTVNLTYDNGQLSSSTSSGSSSSSQVVSSQSSNSSSMEVSP